HPPQTHLHPPQIHSCPQTSPMFSTLVPMDRAIQHHFHPKKFLERTKAQPRHLPSQTRSSAFWKMFPEGMGLELLHLNKMYVIARSPGRACSESPKGTLDLFSSWSRS